MSQLEDFKIPDAPPDDVNAKQLEENLDKFFQELILILNAGIRFEDNFDAQILTVTTGAVADVEQAVAHTLKRTPIGYIVISKDKAAHIYDGTTAWGDANIYIRSDVATVTAKLIII